MSDPPLPSRWTADLSWSVSIDRRDERLENYTSLMAGDHHIRIFFNGKECPAVTADPETGIIETYQGNQKVTLTGHVEIRLERVSNVSRRRSRGAAIRSHFFGIS